MFNLDMEAIRKTAKQSRLMANAANPANLANDKPEKPNKLAELATLAGLAISHGENDTDQALLRTRLLIAAMAVCDRYADGPEAREEMRQQCLETPAHLHADLLEQFRFIRSPEAKAPPPPERKQAPEPPVDPQQWRELARAYHGHHATCKTCQAAGQGRGLRCGTGAALWTQYQSSI
jgi:hypothetical protein